MYVATYSSCVFTGVSVWSICVNESAHTYVCLCAGLSSGVFPTHVCTIITCVCVHLVTAPLTVGPAHWWGRGTEPPCVHSKQGRHMMCMQFCAVVLLTQLLCLLHVLHADQHDSVEVYLFT